MKMLSKMFVIAGLAAFVPAPVFAQSADLIKQGDYYAPTQTVVQHATSQVNEFKQGDYYAPSKTVVQHPTAQELNQARQGDFYAPGRGRVGSLLAQPSLGTRFLRRATHPNDGDAP